MSTYWMSWNALFWPMVVLDSDWLDSSSCRLSTGSDSVKSEHCRYRAYAWL